MKKIIPPWLWLVFGLVTLLRLASLFEPYSYGDEGIYLTLGEGLRQGLVFYRDIYDNKPPLLYLMAALAGSLFWFRFLLLVWNLATIYCFWQLARLIFTPSSRLPAWSTLALAVFSTLPLLEGNIANAEIFMILPVIAAIYWYFRPGEKSPKSYCLIGFLFAMAALFKIPAVTDFGAFFLFLTLFLATNRREFRRHLQPALFTLLGFLLPILLTFLYYWSQGALGRYLTAAFLQNLPYLSSWEGRSSGNLLNSGVVQRGLFLMVIIGLLWFRRLKFEVKTLWLFLWFAFALFGATLSGRPYPHYLVQVLPSTVLLSFLLLQPSLSVSIKAITGSLLALLLASTIYFHFWSYPTLSYYANFLTYATGQSSREAYFQKFGDKVPRNYRLAAFLEEHTQKNERVFIWGDSPVIYALSRHLPVGRYTASYHIIDFNGYRETIEVLKKAPPRFIINLHDENRPFPELDSLLASNYYQYQKFGEVEIFRLLPLPNRE